MCTRILYICGVLLLIHIFIVNGIKIPGLEDVDTHTPLSDCYMNKLERPVHKWFSDGKPEYNIRPTDPFCEKELKFTVHQDEYVLKNATITGANGLKTPYFYYDVPNNTFSYTMVYNLQVVAESIVDKHGKCLNDKSPVHINIKDISVSRLESMCVYLEKKPVEMRMTGPLNFFITQAKAVEIDDDVIFKISCVDRELFRQQLAQVVTFAAHDGIYNAWVHLFEHFPASTFFGKESTWIETEC